MKYYNTLILLVVFALSACSSGLSESEMQTIVAQTVNASSQSEPSAPQAIFTAYPTYTPLPTYTLYPTYTPYPALAEVDAPSPMPPTSTSTPAVGRGVGNVVMCGEYFSVKLVARAQEFMSLNEKKATGEFLLVKFELTNESGQTWEKMFTDEFFLVGQVEGETLTYQAGFDSTSIAVRNNAHLNYMNVFYEETQPAVPLKTIVGFDVSPYGTDWMFVFQPQLSGTQEVACTVHIILE